MKFKTIKNHIIVSTIMIVMVPLLIIGIFSSASNYYSSITTVKEDLDSVIHNSEQRAEKEIKTYQIVSNEAGTNQIICSPASSVDAKKKFLEQKSEEYNFQRGNYIDAEGNGIDGNTYTDREYFKEAMQGRSFVSDPLVSKVTGKLTVIVAAPVWENGVYGSTPIGCVYFVPDENFMNDIMADIKLSPNSEAIMLNKEGKIIASVDTSYVAEGVNLITSAENDASYKSVAEVYKKAINGEDGFATYKFGGKSMFAQYTPIGNSNGWSLVLTAPASDFLSSTYVSISIVVIMLILSAIISFINSGRLGKQIGDPIKACTDRIVLLSQGDLTSPVPVINTQDETRQLGDATQKVVHDISSISIDVGQLLSAMANGNFAVKSQIDESVYVGDFNVLIKSVNDIKSKLSSALSQINRSAGQVSTGSDQVSGGAQSLSQGATEQASSIEELAATIHTVSDRIDQTAKNCLTGSKLVSETAEYIDTATNDMNRLSNAMNEISAASSEIEQIIKAIEDIAFQTNILALNAAVEAARAGEAGKGFAVVADEVRTLASRSSDAAQETTALIARTISAVENGTSITATTAEAVSNVEKRAHEVSRIVNEIAAASEEQSDMIKQITVGVEQISGVVQTNSATAEESAAASEELSGQAQTLKQLVDAFRF